MRVIIRANRFWIEILALATVVACVLALVLATIGAAAAVVAEPAESVQASAPETALVAESSTPPVVQDQNQDRNAVQNQAPNPVQNTTQESHEGMITCSKCGAKHSAKTGKTAADCTRICVHNGASFALIEGEKTFQLDGDLDLLKKAAGQRATIVGAVSGNTIKVTSITTT
jgi:hypothetical protein